MKKKIFMLLMVTMIAGFSCVGCQNANDRNSDEVQNQTTNTTENMVHMESADDVSAFFGDIYAKIPADNMPKVENMELDLQDAELVAYQTGLSNLDQIAGITVSEPLIGSIAYSAIYVRTNDGADVNAIANEMMNNINPAKWICVTAEKSLVASVGNDVFFIMAKADTVQDVYESLLTVAKEKNMNVQIINEKNNE